MPTPYENRTGSSGLHEYLCLLLICGILHRGRLEVLRKPVAVWSHLDVDFAAEVAEAAAIGEELGAGALVPTRPRGTRRVRMDAHPVVHIAVAALRLLQTVRLCRGECCACG